MIRVIHWFGLAMAVALVAFALPAAATIGALIVAKVILVVDLLPFVNRYPEFFGVPGQKATS